MKNDAHRNFARGAGTLRLNLGAVVSTFLVFQSLGIFLGVPNSAQALPKIERGVLEVSQGSRADWHTVTFTSAFPVSPVIVMGPPTYNGTGPLTVLVKNVTTQGFEFQLAEWMYSTDNGAHASEALAYLAIEPGVHDLGGLQCEAGVSSLPATSSAYQIGMSSSFPIAPAILPQAVFGASNAEPVSVRVTERTTSNFKVRVKREQARGTSAPALDIHWIAVQPGRGHDWDNNVDFQAKVTGESYGDAFKDLYFDYRTVNIPTAPANSQLFLAAMQSNNDSEPATLRYQNPNTSKVELKVQEELSSPSDQDLTHASESIGTFLIWDTPQLHLEYGAVDLDEATRQDWHTVNLEMTYQNPVVILGAPTRVDSGRVTLRVRNVTSTSFELTLQEFDYQNGIHSTETIPYLVMEEGIYNIGGKVWQSGYIEKVADSFTRFNRFPSSAFQDPLHPPALLAQIVSNRETSAVVLRTRNLDLAGFELKVQEEETNQSTGHESERVHFLAVAEGLSNPADDFDFECAVTTELFTDQPRTISFSRAFEELYVFAFTQSTVNNEPYTARYSSLTSESVDLRLDEDASDGESVHSTPESMGWLALGRLTDHDGDGMPNAWETAHGLNPNINDADQDGDGDGLNNLQEFQNSALPDKPDTDGDGYLDGFELAMGWSPAVIDGSSVRSVPKPTTKLVVFSPGR